MASKKKKKKLAKEKKLSPQKALKLKKKGLAPSGKKKAALDPKKYMILAGILILTFICFMPSLDNKYVNWDDDKNFSENELITTINDKNFWENSVKIFKTENHVIGNYNPLTIFSFAVEQKLFSDTARSFWRHLNNIFLHLMATLFVYLIGIRLKLGTLGSIALALLYGIHPMRVESVAWITERKDVLFGAFYLAALYYYIKGKQEGFKTRTYLVIGICFLISLLSKIQAVILPISMMLVDYYLSKDGRITIKSIISKWPYLIGSLAIGLINVMTLKMQGSIGDQAYTGISRLFIGSYALVVYYVKALIPFKLSPLYPYPASLDWSFYASIFSFILTGAALFYSYVKKYKALFFGLSFFFVNIVLLLQILGAGQGFLADRFTYIAYFGLFFLMAYGLNQAIIKYPKLKTGIAGGTALVFLAYGYMTFQQNKIWKDSGTMWTHVLKYYQKSTLPWGNRANFYRDMGRTRDALNDYNQVIKLDQKKPEPYNSRARLYFNFNERDSLLKALHNYNKAIELKPTDVEYVVNRGATYAKLGDLPNSLKNLNDAEKIDPSFANIYLNRSVIYNQMQDMPNALKDIDKYLGIKPHFPDMWYEKARIHNSMTQPAEAIKALDQAISMNRSKGIYFFEKAKSLYLKGEFATAKQVLATSQNMGFKGNPETIAKINSGQW